MEAPIKNSFLIKENEVEERLCGRSGRTMLMIKTLHRAQARSRGRDLTSLAAVNAPNRPGRSQSVQRPAVPRWPRLFCSSLQLQVVITD